MLLPLDHVVWTQAAYRRAQQVQSTYQAPRFTGGFEVWLTVTASQLDRSRSAKRGMTVAEEVYKRVEIMDEPGTARCFACGSV